MTNDKMFPMMGNNTVAPREGCPLAGGDTEEDESLVLTDCGRRQGYGLCLDSG